MDKRFKQLEYIENVFGDDYVILNPRTKELHLLNQIAAFILRNCDNASCYEISNKIYGELIDTNGVELSIIENDCKQIMDIIIEKGLAEVVVERVVDTYLMAPYVELTTTCNLRCVHCYNDSGENKAILDKKMLADLKATLNNLKISSVALSGGEPTTHPEFLSIVEMFLEDNFDVTIVTNATLITDVLIDRLKNKKLSFQVSLNAGMPLAHDRLCGEGTFERTNKGLEKLVEAFGESVSIHSVVVKYNIDELIEIIEYARHKGIKVVSLASVNHLGRAVKEDDFSLSIDEFIKVQELFVNNPKIRSYQEQGMEISFPTYSDGCPFLVNGNIGIAPRIDPYGNVYLCQSFNDFPVGNIYREKLDYIIKHSTTIEFLKKIQKARNTIDTCCKCVWQFECGKGCPAEVVMINGDIYGLDNYCSHRKIRFLSQLKQRI